MRCLQAVLYALSAIFLELRRLDERFEWKCFAKMAPKAYAWD